MFVILSYILFAVILFQFTFICGYTTLTCTAVVSLVTWSSVMEEAHYYCRYGLFYNTCSYVAMYNTSASTEVKSDLIHWTVVRWTAYIGASDIRHDKRNTADIFFTSRIQLWISIYFFHSDWFYAGN